MSLGFVILDREAIRGWLSSLVKHTGAAHRDGVTLDGVAIYTGIPRQTLNWLASGRGRMGVDRQRLLSKTIALVENGRLVFERYGSRKVPRIIENPRPPGRYVVSITANGPRLALAPRPPDYRPLALPKKLDI